MQETRHMSPVHIGAQLEVVPPLLPAQPFEELECIRESALRQVSALLEGIESHHLGSGKTHIDGIRIRPLDAQLGRDVVALVFMEPGQDMAAEAKAEVVENRGAPWARPSQREVVPPVKHIGAESGDVGGVHQGIEGLVAVGVPVCIASKERVPESL